MRPCGHRVTDATPARKFRATGTLWLNCLALAIALMLPAGAARADDAAASINKFFSGTGNVLYLSAGMLLPLAEDGRDGAEHALRALDSLGASVIVAEALKNTVREARPGRVGHDSFPSGHTTAAFAVATAESAFHPRQAVWWYGGATLVAESRVSLHEHFLHDVLAGAALGYGTARLELSMRHGLLLSPWIGRRHSSVGLQLSRRF